MSAARERREGNGFIALKTLPQVKIKITIVSPVITCLFPVLFIISLSDYNQTLFEDGTTNRMQESEKVFGDFFFVRYRAFSGQSNHDTIYFRRNVEQCIFPQHPLHRFFQQS